MQGLMGTLIQCQPHFIRCIKPNPQSRPGQLAPQYVLEQLRAGGVLEAVRIACAGFPTRKLFRCSVGKLQSSDVVMTL
jgi:myosin heavy subunit